MIAVPTTARRISWGDSLLNVARGCAVVTAAALPFSTALTNVALALMLLAWLASGRIGAQVQAMARHPVAIGAALWIVLLWLGVSWSDAGLDTAANVIGKYLKLMYLAILVVLLEPRRWRTLVLLTFFASVGVLLVLSFGVYFGVPGLPLPNEVQGAIVLRNHITQGLMMALLALAAMAWALSTEVRWQRLACWALAAVAVIDIAVLIHGRTAYLMLAGLLVWIGVLHSGLRGALIALVLGATTATLAYAFVPTVAKRAQQIAVDLRALEHGDQLTSTGIRLHFYRRAGEIVAAHPLIGAGTGAWPIEYERRSEHDPPPLRKVSGLGNPHSEYLLVAVQFGALGLAALAASGIALYRLARRLPLPQRWIACGTVIAFAIGCLLNSLLWDATEGAIFAVLFGALLAGLPHSAQHSADRTQAARQ
jgi:O-antigen ligase